MSNSGKNIMGQCKTKTYSALPVEDWVCDEVYPACKPLCYKGSFYITKIEGATGIPGKASTANMYVGAFDSLDGDFLKAFNDCLGCCGEDTDTFMLGVDNGNGTATFTPADGSDPFTVSTMDTDTFVTIVDNGDGTATATNPDQTEVILSTVDTTVTYLFEQTNPVDGDGIIQFTVTPSDGGAEQFITLPEPTVDTDTNNDWTASALSPDGILTYTGTDGDGNPIAMPPVDLSALISPMLLAGTGISLDVDPNTGDITVNSTVVDTTIPDTFVTYNAVQTTDPGTGVTTTTITVTPADGGPDVVTTITSCPCITLDERECNAIEMSTDGKIYAPLKEARFFNVGANPARVDIAGASAGDIIETPEVCVDVDNGCLASLMDIRWLGGSIAHRLPAGWHVQVGLQNQIGGGAWGNINGVTIDTRQTPNGTPTLELETQSAGENETPFVAPAGYTSTFCLRWRVSVLAVGEAGVAFIDPSAQNIRVKSWTL